MASAPRAEHIDAPLLSLRPLAIEDHRYAAACWRESHKQSSAAYLRTPWSLFKQTIGKQIDDVLAMSSTRTFGAYNPAGKVIGWIAYAPGRSISTVHWTHTRHELDGELCRRRGVMTMLLEAAELGRRFAYTFRGPRRVHHRGGKDRGAAAARSSVQGPTLDVVLVDKLRERGVTAVYVPIEEWLR